MLRSIVKALYGFWAAVAGGTNCRLVDATDSYDYRSCAGINLIEFTDYLRSKGLFPMIKTVEPIRYSPFQLARYVDTELLSRTLELDIARSSTPRSTPPPHFDCHVGFKLGHVMQNILDNARWPVDILTVEHIRSNTCECQLDSACDEPCPDVDGTPVQPREFV